jgi:repressor LexA
MDLSERQQQILEVIKGAVSRDGYPPTVREIGDAVGLSSPASVHTQLAALEAKGYIRRGSAKRRALEVIGGVGDPGAAIDAAPTLPRHHLPLLGRVAAGEPLLAEQNVEDLVDVPDYLSGDVDSFVLRVKGSSMIGAGILDGDLVVVRCQESAENGDVVVALLDDEATLKRFFREKDHVRLQPENPAMQPILVRDPRIVGKVTGVMRRL